MIEKDIAVEHGCFKSMSVVRRFILFGLACMLPLAFLTLWLSYRPKQPPDLAGCTRVEIEYKVGALRQLFPDSEFQANLLDQQERDSLRSYDKWALTDSQKIDILARCIKKGTYVGMNPGPVAGYGIYVTGYRGRARAARFVIFTNSVRVHGYRVFGYSLDLSHLPVLEPPGIETLRDRWDCSKNLGMLSLERFLRSKSPSPQPIDPNHWCDDLAESFRHHGRKEDFITKTFTCPSTRSPIDANGIPAKPIDARLSSRPSPAGPADYAMNPYCTPDSPGDVVFLFEAKPGWNQHGGPELFTFDNHDHKGGCVKLNNGTTKFIRTKEELAQLRWKPAD